MFWLLLLVQDQPEKTPEPSAEGPAFFERFHGSAAVKLRSRWTSGPSDSDLYETLHLGYGDPEKDILTGSLSGRFAEDLDGERDQKGFFPFDSNDRLALLYTAYLELHLGDFRVRGGRQYLDLPEAVPMDGGSVTYSPAEWLTLVAFGGVPVNLYESSPEGDAMYGGTVQVRPWERGQFRLEYLHLDDENVFGEFADDLVGIGFEQGFEKIRFCARYTNLEGDSREVMTSAHLALEDFLVDVRFHYLFERQVAHSYALDSYSLFLYELEPYVRIAARIWKGFGEHFGIEAALLARQLEDDGDETHYNHEFTRFTVAPRLTFAKFSASLTADFWQTSKDDFWTVGGEVSWSVHPDVTLGAGTSYALFVIDTFTGEERDDVRTVHLSVRWKPFGRMTLDARFQYEDNDEDDFRVLEIGVRHAF